MEGNIFITGQIGTFDDIKGIELIDVIQQVKQQPNATSFKVHINSEGGIVEVGFAIYEYLTALKLPIKTIGSGIVASIATVIFMAGTERTVLENTPFMIHMPWGGPTGNADEIERFVEELRGVENRMVNFYKKALNLEAEAITPLLKNETWLTMEQLQTLGFTTTQPFKAVAKTHFNLKPDMNRNFSPKEKKSLLASFAKILGIDKPDDIVNKVVQDATGTSIEFTDLADDATPEVGQAATIDGQPAEGEYVMPDGYTYIFEAGTLKEIVEPEAEDALEQAQARITELEGELAAEREEKEEAQATLASVRAEATKLKAAIFSSHQPDNKKPTPPRASGGDKGEEKLAGMLDYLKKK